MKLLVRTIFTFLIIICAGNSFAQVNVITAAKYDSIVKSNPKLQLVLLKSDFVQQNIKYATTDNFTHRIVYDTAAMVLSLEAHAA